jgi:hypothetical protein
MEPADVETRRNDLIAKYGGWVGYNVRLHPSVYTMGDSDVGVAEFMVHSIRQGVADLAGKPLDQLRVLDLACHEGGYALELALHGARVLGIEGRAANVEKARFAAEVLGVDQVEFELGDVRELSAERHGRFDVVLCLGILYHLEAPDAVRLIEQCAELCDRMLVVRSAVALSPDFDEEINGHRYRGRRYQENVRHRGASLENPVSILPTRASLTNLLDDVGFSSVLELRHPYVPGLEDLRDTVTYIAIKGERTEARMLPETNEALPGMRWPERRLPSWLYATAHPQQGIYWRARERLLHTLRNAMFHSRRSAEEWRSGRE